MGHQSMTSDQWRRIGLQVGRERGTIDRQLGEAVAPETLWIPAETPPAYRDALKQGYLEAVKGAPFIEDL